MADIIADTGFRTDIPDEIAAFHNNRYGRGVYLADSPTTALAERPNGTILKVSCNTGKNLDITSRGDIETMNDYKEISVENYCIQELECRCNDCNKQFSDYMTLNYELVCFEDEVGKKFFLPTYGKYGYLYLLEELVDEWNSNDKITQNVTEKFEKKLNEITQHNVTMYNKVRCPFCKNYNVFINKRNTLVKCPINWLKVNISKL